VSFVLLCHSTENGEGFSRAVFFFYVKYARNLILSGSKYSQGTTMTKPEFIAAVANSSKSTKAETERVINAALEIIEGALAKGDSVQFVGFGTFEVKQRAAREGINPKTKETIKIPAKKAVTFKAGKKLKDSL
jgi:DNA-binding protein HU-beta